MNEQMHSILFTILGRAVDLGQVLTASFVLLFSISLYWFLTRKILPRFIGRGWLKVAPEPSVIRTLLLFFLFVTLLAMLCVMDLDFILFETDTRQVQLYTILEALAIIQFARIADWGMSKIVLYNYEKSRQDETLTGAHQHISTDLKKLDNRSVQYIVYLFALILVLQTFDIDYTLFKFNYIPITISSILVAILIVMVAQVFAWILTQLLYNYYRRQNVNVGSRFAVNQLLKYTIYVIAIFVAIESLGIKMTVVWGGLAALLVGVGLGLQQTFTDLLSGILLLFERTIEVGHVVEIDGMVGTVRRIGLRTSIVETRGNITVIVPNSKLVTHKVVNWSHQDDKVRFSLPVGVAYGSDTAHVKKILLEAAKDNVYVLDKPEPSVRFIAFGESSLDFELLIWSRNFIVIEDVKSDLRFEIDRLFREQGIVIPFPQRDIHIRKDT